MLLIEQVSKSAQEQQLKSLTIEAQLSQEKPTMRKKKFDFKDHYNTIHDAVFWCVVIAVLSTAWWISQLIEK